MGGNTVQRSRSQAIVTRCNDPPPKLTRVRSVPDFSADEKYKPSWSRHNVGHYRGCSDLYDDPYYEKHYYYSPPITSSSQYSRSRYYNVNGLPDPYYASYPSYWSRYKSYLTCGVPYFGSIRSYTHNDYSPYLNNPYHSVLLDCHNRSVENGINMYRRGLMEYSTLDRYWLTPNSWYRRYKDWRGLYTWDKDRYVTPAYWERRARQYYR